MVSFLVLPLLLFFHRAGALLNVTIDDTDPMVVYSGIWSSAKSSLDYGGSHALSTDNSSTAGATLKFTGVAVYYVVPRWPYNVNTQVTLDGGPSAGGQTASINLTDPDATPTPPGGSESAAYSVAWSATGLSNTTHTLVLSMVTPPAGWIILADAFIYTIDNGSSPASSSSAQTGSQTSAAPVTASPSGNSVVPQKSNTLEIGIGTALGAAALIGALIAAFCFRRRRRRRQAVGEVKNVLDPWDQTASPVRDEWGQEAYPPPPVPFRADAARRTHAPSMSDSSGPLFATPWEESLYNPTSEYRDTPTQSYSESDFSSGGSRGLPPGARAADPITSDDETSELARGSGSIARRASSMGYLGGAGPSMRREKSVPIRNTGYTPAPPAYSES